MVILFKNEQFKSFLVDIYDYKLKKLNISKHEKRVYIKTIIEK